MKRIRPTFLFGAFLVLLGACIPTAEQIAPYVEQTLTANPTATALPTYTPYPTHTIPPTYTPIVQTKVVTQTYTPTPIFTSTITPTPTNTVTPTQTLDPLKADKGPGFYLIGVDIATGAWRSNGTGDNCYWAVTSKTGNIIRNHYGMAGGTAYIPAAGYQVEFQEGCGTWTWLSE